MSDDALVVSAQTGDMVALDELMRRYESVARIVATRYFLRGSSQDDVLQEARFGVFKAVRDYKPSFDTSFKSFVWLAVGRQVVTAVKTANRAKHQPLSLAASLDAPIYSTMFDDAPTLLETVGTPTRDDPTRRLDDEVLRATIVGAIVDDAMLSDYECDVLRLYMDGCTYVEMGQRLGHSAKSADNALQRMRKKANAAIKGRYLSMQRALAE